MRQPIQEWNLLEEFHLDFLAALIDDLKAIIVIFLRNYSELACIRAPDRRLPFTNLSWILLVDFESQLAEALSLAQQGNGHHELVMLFRLELIDFLNKPVKLILQLK